MDPSMIMSLLGGGGGGGQGGGGGGGVLSSLPGLAMAGAKFFQGMKQKRMADKIVAINPGYQMNTAKIDAASAYGNRFGNYEIPGKAQIMNNMGRSGAASLNTIQQGASSAADIISGATAVNNSQNDQMNNLAVQEAQSKDSMFDKVVGARVDAGQEYVKKNEYDREQYDRKLQEKADLTNASLANKFGAADQASKLVAGMLSYKKTPTQKAGTLNAGDDIFV
jgi:hypothetical protein